MTGKRIAKKLISGVRNGLTPREGLIQKESEGDKKKKRDGRREVSAGVSSFKRYPRFTKARAPIHERGTRRKGAGRGEKSPRNNTGGKKKYRSKKWESVIVKG